jgi:WD40 repeat protein/DNA-binding SARP family transcriptional activator
MAACALHLLGTPRLEVEGIEVRVSRRKTMALLAYLAVTGRPHTRDALATLLWPEWDASGARGALRRHLSQVNQLLGGEGIEADRESARLSPDLDLWLDVDAFREQLAACEGHDHPPTEACPDCAPPLEDAAALYTDHFVAGFTLEAGAAFDDWQFFQTEALKDEMAAVLVRLATYYTSQGDFDRAIDHARRWLAVDPLHEPAHRHLMVLYAKSNQRAAALRQYETCCRLLQEELGVEPSARTQEAHDRLLSGEILLAPTAVEAILERELRSVGPCPYQGLAAFGEADAPFFFGREAFVGRLTHAVATQPLVAMIVGASGSGKSSVIFAGLLPRLREEDGWTIGHLRPTREPFQALAGGLLPLLAPDLDEAGRLVQTRTLSEALAGGTVPLMDAVQRILGRQGRRTRLLLLVDQFEELYTLCPDPDTRRRFIDTLLATVDAATQTENFTLLLTLRADFMGQALAHRPFADALQTASQMLGPMTSVELRAAIEKPAEAQGAAFEAGLVERLLDDVADEPGHLPLLEFALTLLWERLDFGWLTHAAYDQIGRVEGALARYAQEVYNALTKTDRELCRRVFTQLVQPGEGTEDTRRVAGRADVGVEAWDLVQHLADRRLVVTGRDESTGTETVEVVHEALIANWGQLQAWMAEDRAFRTWQERLRVALRTWQATDHDEGALLRGAPLAEAEGWRAERHGEISSPEHDFIEAGVDQRRQRDREREEQRHRELAAAEELAEQRRQSAVRLRRRAVFLSLALVAALAAAGIAGVFSRRNADLAANNAEIAIAAQSEASARGTAQAQEMAQRLVAEAESAARATAQAEEAAQRAIAEREAVARATAQAQAEMEREEALRQAAIGLAAEAELQSQGPGQDVAVLLALEAVEHYPYTWQAERTLAQVVHGHRLVMEYSHGTYFDSPAQLSPDGTRIMTAGLDGILRVWNVHSGENLLTVAAYDSRSAGNFYAHWAPTGDRILTSAMAGVHRIWDATDGVLLVELAGHGGVYGEWSPDGTQVVSYYSFDEDAATIWDAQNGEVIHSLTGDRGLLKFARFSPDGKWIVTSIGQIWDAETGELRHTLAAYQDLITRDYQPRWTWSPDGRTLGAGMDGTARIWDVETGQEILVLDTGFEERSWLYWSPDGDQVLTLQLYEELAILWNATTGEELQRFTHEARVPQFVDPWSATGERIVLSDRQGRVSAWEAASGRELVELVAHTGATQASWLPDDSGFVTKGSDGKARLWKLSTAELDVGCRPDCPVSNWGGLDGTPIWSPDGSQVARHYWDGTVRVWDTGSGTETLRFQHHGQPFGNPAVTTIAWSPDGDRILSGANTGELRIWDSITGQLLLAFPVGEVGDQWHWDAHWSPRGDRILSCGFDQRAVVWDAATGQALTVYAEHDPWACAWSPDGTRIVSVDAWTGHGPARVWDAATGETLLTLHPDDFPFANTAVAWSPEGARIVTFGEDYIGRTWDALSGEQLGSFTVAGEANGAEWSPSGDRFLVTNPGGITMWDAATLQETSTYPAVTPGSGRWSPDGTAIAIGYFDGDLKIYPAWQSLEELVTYAKDCCVFRELTPEERTKFGLPER